MADETFETVLRQARASDGPVRVSALLEGARSAGLSAAEAWRATVRTCDDAAIQRSWADWERVPDQAELGLRLQVLVDCPQLDPSLDDFLLFFFRASAPELYRHAALAMGRHSWRHPPLADDLETYADHRDVDLDEPIALNGERSRRRLMLAATARYVERPAERSESAFPLPVDAPETSAEAPTSDVSVLSLCCERLLAADCGDEAFRAMCWDLADSVHDVLGKGGSQRAMVRTWGQLLHALADEEPERAGDSWADKLARFERRGDESSSERLATYWEFDTALAAGADREGRLLDHADVDEIGELFDDSDFRWLSRIRWWQWRRRTEGSPPDSLPGGSPDTEALDPELARFLEEVVERIQTGESVRRAMHRWIGGRLDVLVEARRWWAHPGETRATLSFLLLDAVRYRPPPRDPIRRLFVEAGISGTGPGPTDGSAVEGIAGMPWDGFHDLLWQIYRREGAPADFPVESESFASISSAERLLGFIRAGQAVRDLDILVDALEHFLRLELASNPDFDPRSFLYRIAARKPHPSLFRELAHRTKGRTYVDASDREVDLRRMLDAVAEEAGRRELPEASTDAHWYPELGRVRRSLSAVGEHEDLYDALVAFTDHIDPRITHHDGLVNLLAQIIPEDGTVLLDASTPESGADLESLNAAISEHSRVLRETADELFDGTDLDLADMHRAARIISGRLTRIRERLEPAVAGRDRAILRRVTSRIDERIAEWTRVLKKGLDSPIGDIDDAPEEAGRAVFEKLREVTADLDSPAMRTRAFRIAYEWLDKRAPSAPTEAPDADRALDDPDHWQDERELLAVAATTTRDLEMNEAWMEFLSDQWERLATVAMELQAEPQAIDLVRADEFAELRQRARRSVTVERLEQWLADRYHLPALSALTGDTRSTPRGWVAAMPAAALRLVGNFTHVWLALLVGAVMLLDFGDAWVELARQGDIAGIAITFAIGLGGTFLYLLADLIRKTHAPFDDPSPGWRAGRLVRVVAFFIVCFVYTILVTSGMWYLFSGTDLVLHGDGASLHILVWTGFALFVGVFFGLLTDAG